MDKERVVLSLIARYAVLISKVSCSQLFGVLPVGVA